MTPQETWQQRGFNDYPRCDLYPYRDAHGRRCEIWYLRGWHRASRINAMGGLEFEE